MPNACVFDEFRFLFEYLFRNLSTENAEAADFAMRFKAKVSKGQSAQARKTPEEPEGLANGGSR